MKKAILFAVKWVSSGVFRDAYRVVKEAAKATPNRSDDELIALAEVLVGRSASMARLVAGASWRDRGSLIKQLVVSYLAAQYPGVPWDRLDEWTQIAYDFFKARFKPSAASAVVLLLFLPPAVFAQWAPFVEAHGSVPSDLYSPLRDAQVKAEWYAKARPSLERYATLVVTELQCRGFRLERVTYSVDQAQWQSSPWGWAFRGEVLRGGLVIPFLLQEQTPLRYSPGQYADWLEKQWEVARDARVLMPWVQPPDEARVKDWRAMFLWQPSEPVCRVYFTPGTACTVDISSGTQEVRP